MGYVEMLSKTKGRSIAVIVGALPVFTVMSYHLFTRLTTQETPSTQSPIAADDPIKQNQQCQQFAILIYCPESQIIIQAPHRPCAFSADGAAALDVIYQH